MLAPRESRFAHTLENMRMTVRLTNWAGNVTFSAERTHRPSCVDELQRLVARSGHVRALGTGHSFNRIADTGKA